MTEETTNIPDDKRNCDICGNELKDDEKIYCSLCDVGADNLIPEEESPGEEKVEEDA